ncbi:MAG: hypothetical protein HQK58_11130 [Deltaproteobacteria bacterium]|nr:hypothetical protein [Deltaproteobacteria bacterium]
MSRRMAMSGAIALVPLAATIILTICYYVNVPQWDQWDTAVILAKKAAGDLSWRDLWALHNEHRLLFPRLLMLLLGHLSGWNIAWELTLNIGLALATLIIIMYLLTITKQFVKRLDILLLLPIMSFLIFSFTQAENWLWGWQIAMFLNVAAACLGFVALAKATSSWVYYSLAIVSGVVASYSFATGLLYWPIGCLCLWFGKSSSPRERLVRVGLWIALSVLVAILYIHGYTKAQNQSAVGYGLHHPLEFILHALAFLGAPLANYRVGFAVAFGTIGLVIFFYAGSQVWQRFHDRLELVAPYLCLGAYAVMAALLTTVGRVGLGLNQALVLRYITFSNLLWISDVILIFLVVATDSARTNSKDRSILPRLVIYGLGVITIFSLVQSYRRAIDYADDLHRRLDAAKQHVLAHYPGPMDEKIVLALHPYINFLTIFLRVLKDNNLSFFAKQKTVHDQRRREIASPRPESTLANRDGLWRTSTNSSIFLQSYSNDKAFCLAKFVDGRIMAFWGVYSDGQNLDAGYIYTPESDYCLQIQFFSLHEATVYLADRTNGRIESFTLCRESPAALNAATDGMWQAGSKRLPRIWLQHYLESGSLMILTLDDRTYEVFYQDTEDGSSFRGRGVYPNPDIEITFTCSDHEHGELLSNPAPGSKKSWGMTRSLAARTTP